MVDRLSFMLGGRVVSTCRFLELAVKMGLNGNLGGHVQAQ